MVYPVGVVEITAPQAKQMLSGRVYAELRDAILRGDFPEVAEEIERIDGLDGSERTPEAIDLADMLTAQVVPAVPFAAGATTAYLGPSLGCRVFPPYGYGLDLAALCLARGNE